MAAGRHCLSASRSRPLTFAPHWTMARIPSTCSHRHDHGRRLGVVGRTARPAMLPGCLRVRQPFHKRAIPARLRVAARRGSTLKPSKFLKLFLFNRLPLVCSGGGGDRRPFAAEYADPGAVHAARWAWLGCQLSLKGPISGKSLGHRRGNPWLAGRCRTSAKHRFRESWFGWPAQWPTTVAAILNHVILSL